MKRAMIRPCIGILTAVIFLSAMFTGAFAASVKKPANIFAIAQISEVYLSDPSQGEYGKIDGKAFINAVNALPALKKVESTPGEKAAVSLLTVNPAMRYEKHVFELSKGEFRYDQTAYALTQAQYDRIKNILDEAAKKKTAHPQWLVWMNPDRVTGIQARGDGMSIQECTYDFLEFLRSMAVKPGSLKKFSPPEQEPSESEKCVFIKLDFDSGAAYRIWAYQGQDQLYVTSSDRDYGCSYTFADKGAYNTLLKRFQALQDAPPEGMEIILPPITTGKPVIYLYPEKTRDISVKLDFKGELCYTYPEYNGGWNVTAHPDGTLLNKADGTSHYYLFWDGNADFKDWDLSAGFVVKGSEIERFLLEKLPQMGLIPKEYNDFITYWTPILSRNRYNLISFSTAQYENVAPLRVTPAPDTVLRVHMLYKAIDAPIAVPEQKLPEAPARSGFTVVEWGATRVE